MYYGHWALNLVISFTRQGVRFATDIGLCILCCRDFLRALGSASCDITHETGGTICYGHWVYASYHIKHETEGTTCYGKWVLHLVMSPTNQRGYDLLVALCSASCDMSHETEGTICFGHWVLHLVISHTRQGLRFVNGIGFCVF